MYINSCIPVRFQLLQRGISGFLFYCICDINPSKCIQIITFQALGRKRGREVLNSTTDGDEIKKKVCGIDQAVLVILRWNWGKELNFIKNTH